MTINHVIKKSLLTKTIILKILLSFSVLILATSVFAQPKFRLHHQRDAQNLAQIQVINETIDPLLCYVAIDGYKIYFRLLPRESSIWYKATDTRFNYSNFSTWCDYLSLHPEYMNK
jgi:hypothetical protein